MRILSLVFASAALMSATAPVAAQSPYSYSWCSKSIGRGGGNTSCYFTSREECMTWMSAKGAYCYPSPFYQPRAATRR